MLYTCDPRRVARAAATIPTFEKAELCADVVTGCHDVVVREIEDATSCERRQRRSQKRRLTHANDTRIRLQPSDSNFQKCGLADTVATEDCAHLACFRAKCCRRQHFAIAERLAH